jgi:hypothetical protein
MTLTPLETQKLTATDMFEVNSVVVGTITHCACDVDGTDDAC